MSQANISSRTDIQFMHIALSLAVRGLGRVAPEPACGCVIVQNTSAHSPRIVGRGWASSSTPQQAENAALDRAGALA
ncbi:MAG: riboflavin biosynthesis protein RibD, partial [Parvibaculaceae bacterium]|nr:riboflavin biosynthesis protein RibD [Parvibaculaceae bacterium]